MKEFAKSYIQLIEEHFPNLNLTSIKTVEELHAKQVLDSIGPLFECDSFLTLLKEEEVLLDLGTGGGFPLLPVAKEWSHVRCIGIDSRKKKCDAVNTLANMLNLPNVKVFHKRSEEVLIDLKIPILVKAVGPIPRVLPQIHLNGLQKVFFYKGPRFHEQEWPELKVLEDDWDFQVHIWENPFFERRLLVECTLKDGQLDSWLEKNKRNMSSCTKKLVKLSDII